MTIREVIEYGRSKGLLVTVTDRGKGYFRIRKKVNGEVISQGEALSIESAILVINELSKG